MKTLFEILKSLIGPLFNGIRVVLTGRFGVAVALVSWLLLFLQFRLASAHTNGLAGTLTLGLVLVVGLGAAALWSFLIVNGAAYEPNSKNTPSRGKMKVEAMICSAVVVCAITGMVGGFLNLVHLVSVHGFLELLLRNAATAAVLGYLVVSRTLAQFDSF